MFFFFFDNYKDELFAALENPEIKRIAEMKEFYLQKGKDKFDELLGMDTTGIDFTSLIEVTKQKPFSYEKWLNSYNKDSAEYKLLLIIGQVISYCDSNAAMKNTLNEYNDGDKRIIAFANVRQNYWVEAFLKLKSGVNVNTFSGNIRNAILFMQNPENNLSIISEDWKKDITNALFANSDGDLFEEMKKLGITAENSMNNGVLYSWILNSSSIKALWKKEELPIANLDKEFKKWFSKQRKSNGATYSPATVSNYRNALRNATANIKLDTPIQHTNLFLYTTIEDFMPIHKMILAAPNFDEVNRSAGKQAYYSGMEAYIRFLEEREGAVTEKQSNAAFLHWFEPLMTALKELGGAATPKEVREKIIVNMNLSDDNVNEVRGKNKVNKFSNELAFARNYLVIDGYIDNSERGRLTLTQKGRSSPMNMEIASEIFRRIISLRNSDFRYWIYTPGEQARLWEEFCNSGIMGIGWDEIGDLSQYDSKSDIKTILQKIKDDDKSHKNDSHALWQFANDISIGDVIFVKKGYSAVLGRGIVESDYVFDDEREEYKHIRTVNWTHEGEWEHPGQAVQKTLTDITMYTDYVEKLEALFLDETELIENTDKPEIKYTKYSTDDFLNEVYINPKRYNTLKGLLLRKKNVILQGAPGVGKTFAAQRLAFSIMGEKDTSRVKVIQFHQSYSYEDFIMGWRPDGAEFTLAEGPFYKFCKTAQDDYERPYFFIIDEINRGNLSKIFGELLMLIEEDKRGDSIRLLYKEEQFAVPENVHIIGMMNTADRSLAMIDYALRRRFAFFDLSPAFQSSGFKAHQTSIDNPNFDSLIAVVEQLNNEISQDVSLGDGFRIGHSYFCIDVKDVDDDWLSDVVEYELIPLLNEYWFDEPSKTDNWIRQLRKSIEEL